METPKEAGRDYGIHTAKSTVTGQETCLYPAINRETTRTVRDFHTGGGARLKSALESQGCTVGNLAPSMFMEKKPHCNTQRSKDEAIGPQQSILIAILNRPTRTDLGRGDQSNEHC